MILPIYESVPRIGTTVNASTDRSVMSFPRLFSLLAQLAVQFPCFLSSLSSGLSSSFFYSFDDPLILFFLSFKPSSSPFAVHISRRLTTP